MRYIKENYDNFYGKPEKDSSYGKPAKVIEKLAEILPPASVLDLGAGDGRHSLYLAAKAFNVKAVDISASGLEKMKRLGEKRKLDIKTEVVDLSKWSIDNDYDAIISVVVFQHLPSEQALRILKEMKIHTKPGGANAITLFTNNGDRYRLDRQDDPDAFYPNDNWLKGFYQDWDIVEHRLSDAPLIGKTREDGTPMKNIVEKILARRPFP